MDVCALFPELKCEMGMPEPFVTMTMFVSTMLACDIQCPKTYQCRLLVQIHKIIFSGKAEMLETSMLHICNPTLFTLYIYVCVFLKFLICADSSCSTRMHHFSGNFSLNNLIMSI